MPAQNRFCRFAATLLLLTIAALPGACASTPSPYDLEHRYTVADPQFRRTIGSLLGPPLFAGNSVTTLLNGDQIFPEMLRAIREARETITFETYVYWRGLMGASFADALAERARSGVRVHVLIDAVGGARIDPLYVEVMESAGVHFVRYHALRWFDLGSAQRVNNRTHRKLLVVDGRVGFTGGVGIADEWIGNAEDKDHWRENHYRVEGPVVAQLQSAFMDEWMETTGEVLHDQRYFPPIEPAGSRAAQLFKSSPEGGSESMHLMYLLSIVASERSIRIATSYFVPDDLIVRALLDARRRGVQIQIILPGPHMDVEIVRSASRAGWGPLLQAGIEIYEFQPTMYHVKQMIVDDLWTSIGSANFDNRSFSLNSEANLNVLDAEFAAEQVRVFELDLRQSRRITFEMWRSRPLHEKIIEGASSIAGPQL
jgi:cardiolipin synthase A/B